MKKKITQTNNFYYMTFALIGLLICSAFIQTLSKSNNSGLFSYLLDGGIIITFNICLLSLRFDKNWFRFLLTLIGCWIVATLIRNIFNIKEMDEVILIFLFCFFFGMFSSIVKQILFTNTPTDGNKVVGSISLFLLLGLIWTTLYLFILEFSPNAFNGITPLSWGENLSRMAYFSFITLTTLGYGDISPSTPIAQVAVYLEAIIGVFYMAIVVADLVSSNQTHKHNKNKQ